MTVRKLDKMIGKVPVKISKDDEEIIFEMNDGSRYKMYHDQGCCEHVYIEDMDNDLDFLLDEPIQRAEEVTNIDNGKLDEWDESYTWTFYKFGNSKDDVTIRWYGTSNGYYSESVDIVIADENGHFPSYAWGEQLV